MNSAPRMASPTIPAWLARDVTVVLMAVFIGLASFQLEYPGLQYDEALFIQPALGAQETIFIHKEWFGIPIMLMEYLGALKAWIYSPIFYFFGVSPFTIRFPMILVSALTLAILFRLMKRETGSLAACYLVLLMAIDPAFIFHSRLDWGPFVLRMLIKIAALSMWFQAVRSPSFGKLIAIGFLLAVGLWDKLDFIWFIAGMAAAVLICYPGTLLRTYKVAGRVGKTLVLALLAAGLAAAFMMSAKFGSSPSEPVSMARVHELLASLFHTLNANTLTSFLVSHPMGFPAFHNDLTADSILTTNPMAAASWPLGTFLISMAIALPLSIFVSWRARNGINRKLLFFSILSLVTFLFILVTSGAGGMHKSHHMMALYPYHLIIAALLLHSGYHARKSITGKVIIALVGSASLVMCAANAVQTGNILHNVTSSAAIDARWSHHIYELADYVQDEGQSADWIISIDWGTHNQMHAVADESTRRKMADLWLKLKYVHKMPGDRKEIAEKLATSKRTLVITYDDGNGIQRIAKGNFNGILRSTGLTMSPIHEITHAGKVIYRVSEIRGTDPSTEDSDDR